MKKILFAALMSASMMVGAAGPVDWDKHIEDEGQYWVNGVETDAQRYVVLCGALRSDDNGRAPVIVFPDSIDKQGNVKGKLAEAAVPMNIVSDDLDYVYMLVASRLCSMIPTAIIDATGQGIVDQTQKLENKAFVGGLMGAEVELPSE